MAADKKRQKEEEEEKKKRERVEKRLTQLNSQMDDRLFKEACMMREKNIMNFVRGMNKEFTRRRKAAELTVGNKIDRSSTSPSSVDFSSTVLVPFRETLPPLSRPYDAEVVRIWDFLHSFSDVFSLSGKPDTPDIDTPDTDAPDTDTPDTPDTPKSLPSLNALQDAINCLKTNAPEPQKHSDAITLFKGIAMDMCKVISPRLVFLCCSMLPFSVLLQLQNTQFNCFHLFCKALRKSFHHRYPILKRLEGMAQKADLKKMETCPVYQ